MVNAFLILISAQFIGEVVRLVLHLPLPGPVLGMFFLAVYLVILSNRSLLPLKECPLINVSSGLIGNMGVLFVPAGVGIMVETDVLWDYWLPVLIGLLTSTVLGLLVTALVMHALLRRADNKHACEEGSLQ